MKDTTSESRNECKTVNITQRRTRMCVLSGMLLLAGAIRCYKIGNPPLNFHPTRQLHSAIIARWYYYEDSTSISHWQREIASINFQKECKRELPILEYLVASGYRLLGKESLAFARSCSIMFWLAGGIFLYLLGMRLFSSCAALASVAFYLFVPFGVIASRSFQPDPLMVMLLLATLYMLLRYAENRRSVFFCAAVACSALAILVRPMCLFFILGFCLSIVSYADSRRSHIRWLALFAILCVTPGAVYYINGLFGQGFLTGYSESSFLPQLLTRSNYWLRWLKLIGRSVGIIAFILTIMSVIRFGGRYRHVMLGLLGGYIVYGLVFNYHIHTHDYYQLPLIPIVALGIGPLCEKVALWFTRLSSASRMSLAAATIILLASGVAVLAIVKNNVFRNWGNATKTRLEIASTQLGLCPRYIKNINNQYVTKIQTAKTLGQLVDHGKHNIALSYAYGNILSYYGELCSKNWPNASDLTLSRLAKARTMGAAERLEVYRGQIAARYFIVSAMNYYERQPELKLLLLNNFEVVDSTEQYVVFDLQSPRAK